jgi:SAM-dependent methyltransferase
LAFDAYSRYYDLLYRAKDYAAEAQYVAGALRRHAPQAKRLLELGCGTGGHAEHLARAGYAVDGFDVSDTMLARAAARRATLPPEVAARLSFGRGDARSLRVGKAFDAVISLFHVMNYQTTDADLRAAFATAAAHLRPRGVFLYDFWFGPAVVAQRPELRVRRLEDEAVRVTRIAEPVLHEAQCVVDVNYDVFVEDKSSGHVAQVRETHSMRYLFLAELAELRGAAFVERATHAWLTQEAPGTGAWSAFQIVERV